MEETYKVIEGCDNYLVSNFGNVKNSKTGRVLKSIIQATGYTAVNLNGKTLLIHRLVCKAFIPNPCNKPNVDHIDNNRTNNNVNNLRYVTQQENTFNATISKTNKSGHKGICWHKETKKWNAIITHNYKKYHLGLFENIDDAISTRQKKANELFGDFTHQSEKQDN